MRLSISCTALLALVVLGTAGPSQEVFRAQLDAKEVDSFLRTEWYGLYLKGKKIGYFRSVRARAGDQISDAFTMHMKLVSFGKKSELTLTQDLRFDGKAPFALVGGSFEQQTGALTQRVTLTKNDKGFQVALKVGTEDSTRQIPPVEYTLADALAADLWIRKGPQVGSSISYREFDMQELALQVHKSTVAAIKTSVVNGVQVRFFEVDTESRKEKLQILSRHDDTGRLLSGNIAVFEIRLEPEEQAKNIEFSQDLFVLGMAKLDKALGSARKVTELVLHVDGKEAEVFEDGPRQRVEPAAGGGKLIKLGKKYGKEVKATPQEIEECLQETNTYRINHPKIKELAAKAVGDAKTPEDKVKRLVEFVHRYITPTLSSSMPQIHDLLESKKGDCKSYALLFATLARASGIPAREVGGVTYIGDDAKALGGHAWNEVVLNGVWVPIDATFNQVEVDATHLSYGTEFRAAKNLLATLGKLSFRVVEMKTAN